MNLFARLAMTNLLAGARLAMTVLLAGARLALAVLLAGLAAAPAVAHVGSPDTWYEGKAGPYPLRVVVRAPGVVPGLAEISVRVLEGHPSKVTVQPFAWNAGEHGAPPPDVAAPVPGDAQLYSVSLWFMVTTSYGVHVVVSGDRGTGFAIVPVQAVPTRRLPLEGSLLATLIGLGVFLVVGLLTLVGSAHREASLPPGVEPQANEKRRARLGMAISAALLVAALAGGRSWWNSEDQAYARAMYRPFHIRTQVSEQAGTRVLALAIDDERWGGRRWSPLIPDHGKLMHLFLVRDGDMGAIAHLHPVLRDSSHFESLLPPLPAGLYRVYADIVHESGFAQTLSDSVRIAAPRPTTETRLARTASESKIVVSVASDSDDSWFNGPVTAEASGDARCMLADGSTLVWQRGAAPLVEGAEAPLRFVVLAADGSPARLEPFLGMAGHAMLRRDDGAVFAHLHPIGSVPMASQMALEMRTPADSVLGTLGRRMTLAGAATPGIAHDMAAMAVPADLPGEFAIPYGFPRSGKYRMWLQVKLAGRVQTAAFDLTVQPARKS